MPRRPQAQSLNNAPAVIVAKTNSKGKLLNMRTVMNLLSIISHGTQLYNEYSY